MIKRYRGQPLVSLFKNHRRPCRGYYSFCADCSCRLYFGERDTELKLIDVCVEVYD